MELIPQEEKKTSEKTPAPIQEDSFSYTVESHIDSIRITVCVPDTPKNYALLEKIQKALGNGNPFLRLIELEKELDESPLIRAVFHDFKTTVLRHEGSIKKETARLIFTSPGKTSSLHFFIEVSTK